MPSDAGDSGMSPSQQQTSRNSQLDELAKKFNVKPLVANQKTTSQPKPQQESGSNFLGDIWNATGGAVVNQVGSGLQNIAGGLGDIGNAVNPWSGQDLGQRAAGLAGSPFKALGGVAQIATSSMAPSISAGTSAVQGASTQASGGLGRTLGGLGKIAQNVLPALGNTFSGQAGSEKFGTEVLKGATDLLGGGMQAAFSPLTGTIGSLPKSVQAPISAVGNAFDSLQNKAWESVGVDVNSEEGRMLKENMNNFLTLLGATPAAKGLAGKVASPLRAPLAKAAAQASKTLDEAINQVVKGAGVVGKTIGRGAKTVGKAGLEGGSQSLWNIPARDMLRAAELGDEVLNAADDAANYGAKVLGELDSGIQNLIKTKRETGGAYTNIRKGTDVVNVSPRKIAPALEKAGVEFSGGKFNFRGADPANSTLTASDLKLLNRDVAPLLREGNVSADQFLNIRSKLSDLSKFQQGVTKGNDLMSLARGMREQLNQGARATVKGLGELDDTMSKQITGMKEIRNEFMTKDRVTGQYKIKNNINADNIANMLSPRNADKLQLLEKMVPGVSRRLEALSLVKKAERASEVMTGATGKRLVSSVALGLGTGNPLMGIASMIVQDPMRAMKLFAKMKPLLKQTKRKSTSSKANAGKSFSTADAAGKASGVFTQAKKYSGGLGQDQQNI